MEERDIPQCWRQSIEVATCQQLSDEHAELVIIIIMKAVLTIDHDKHDDRDDHDCNEDNDHLAKRLSAISTVLLIPHSSHLKLGTVAVVIFSRGSFFKVFF